MSLMSGLNVLVHNQGINVFMVTVDGYKLVNWVHTTLNRNLTIVTYIHIYTYIYKNDKVN